MKCSLIFAPLMMVLSMLLVSKLTGAAEIDYAYHYWQPTQQKIKENSSLNIKASAFKRYQTDFNLMFARLSAKAHPVISLPLPNGEFVPFRLTPNAVLHPDLAAKYKQLLTFSGVDLHNPQHKGQFDLTEQGFHAMFNFQGKNVMIDPLFKDKTDQYASYYQHNALPLDRGILRMPPRKTPTDTPVQAEQYKASQKAKSISQRKRYRIAISAAGEYTAFHGGTKAGALSALTTLVSRINQVYLRDMNIEFQLVANNDAIIFTDATTDPFNNDSDNDIDKNQQVIDDTIGFANYDIGHVVNTAGGGLASFGVVCTTAKAQGVTGANQPTGDFFHIDFVAHEIGHQFQADHTFSSNKDSCNGNGDRNSAYEPGSGTTIMSYAGLCGSDDLQGRVDDNFHIRSLDQMTNYINAGDGKNCGEVLIQTNTNPIVNAGADYTIPVNTPFTLKGSATDNENDTLSYSWEQYDLADTNNSLKGPLFRVNTPVSKAERTFPALSNILDGTRPLGNRLPEQARQMNFRLVVRDGRGGVNDDAMRLNVVGSEGFSVAEPTSNTHWTSTQNVIKWNTVGTEKAPVSCSKVDILLSTDAGQSFNQSLANQVANDGQQAVNAPFVNSDKARIKVQCSDSIFFAISQGDFNIRRGDIKPIFTGQRTLTIAEDTTLTLSASDFTFEQALPVDAISVQTGENYSVDDLTITPKANFNGTLSVVITASKGNKTSDPFNATVSVTPVNDNPVAVNDSLTLQQNASATTIKVLQNDSDVDGDTLTLGQITYAGSGTATVSDNAIVYTPAASFSGTESITYTVTDSNGGSANATLTITVSAPTPPPSSDSSGGGSLFWHLFWFGLVLFRLSTRQ